ncbi:MAG: methyltransferase domain-containing protein [Acidobacteria bacterium]|nr:methyltransferase domain-containing protein [Acidobacteriota bacterium]
MTVERHEPAIDPATRRESPWWGVHASRYLFARPFVEQRRILDVACGTGYGLALLAGSARAVVGADADFDALKTARSAATTMSDRSAAVVRSDACRLPFPDAAWDVVTSFETIEHLRDRAGFVREVRRVLAPEGVCVMSTPNANYTRPVDGTPRNPFHVHEYDPAEFRVELGRRFAQVELLGQALSSRFAVSPFWDDQQRMPRTLGPQAKLMTWRVLNRTPAAVRDVLSRALWGHPLIPSEHDYEFSAAGVDAAPVLVAICRGVRA